MGHPVKTLLRVALPGIVLLVGATACGTREPAAAPVVAAPVTHPDLSGFWNLDMSVARDDDLMKQVAPNTAFIDDTGPKELPAGDFGGLQLKPAALEAARKWDPYTQLTPENACKAPSIIYALQGPFPIEIFQSDKLIVIKLEYYDMARILFLDGRQPESDFPASKVGFSSAHWDGATLVVETTHLEPATITNNGLDHTADVRVIERFKLSPDGKDASRVTVKNSSPIRPTSFGVPPNALMSPRTDCVVSVMSA